ncbi:glutamate--cysteine ligase [Intrasporangium sp.]|uniref:glutamate--cysteine ligase n=1 Tax=Intrasporangium sp. TaxID=1925024 RepID=UPI00293A8FA6|nr:glutamate--cysteine ligase [Intrasporangium sp.]MDV3221276.1 glutamate--cysteine ligase [Intrasporangium sp.]
MGADVEQARYTREQRQQYREKVRRDLDVFERMLGHAQFEFDRPMTGLEIELNLVNRELGPRLDNKSVLEHIADENYQTELARYNIELNVHPRPLPGDSALELEQLLRESLNHASSRAAELNTGIVAIGILPTVMPEHFEGDWISENIRYEALNNAVLDARGEDVWLEMEGPTGERIARYSDSLAPESACTSIQLHLQVQPERFADHWNAAQVLAGPQLAVGANSPFFLGQRLWAETRVPLFTQATDTRSVELKNQGVRPRVWFGERWITSIFDLFEENVRYYPALLPEISDEEPEEVFERGEVPELMELRLHNGTVYRWNRPIYDIVQGRPHLRVENRVLPAGPSIADVLANAAFYYGAIRVLAEEDRPVWTKMSFSAAEANFEEGARLGIDARTYWPGFGEVPATELILRRLLPLAHEGLQRWGVSQAVRDRYLSIVEQRCLKGVNGASWQTDCVERLESRGLTRDKALREMLAKYMEGMHANEPVHTWELPSLS